MRPKLSLLFVLLIMVGIFAGVSPADAVGAEADTKPEAKKDEAGEIGSRALWAKIIEQLVALLKGLAWPAAAVLIAWWYRKEIRSLLRRLKKLKAGGLEAEITDNLAKAKAAADDAGLPPPPDAPPTSPPIVVSEEEGEAAIARSAEKAKALGQISGPAAILEMWTEVEFAVNAMYRNVRGRNPRTLNDLQHFLRQLEHDSKVSPEIVAVFNELRKIRTRAVHMPEERNKLGKERVEEYIVLCARLIRQLLQVAKTLPPEPKPS
ncbi:Uncharacterized protein OS=Vibrio navarrensis GN=DC58_04405 PE=4 SV=1 [Gemmata massiliana]|uniref:DUF4145 domain-containing protein n=1 Tax=Gemmata massiliana TaxID=1210884 RepID=A0A6P2DJY5_9BACT|nr:hypothetical protein [Gemmata massiliana]VTS03605.1 Uncharacterized protein OS=Vibrio navarrensis GN=DC58_04405 PE=4 SV=1 [Gemmata massiliana]